MNAFTSQYFSPLLDICLPLLEIGPSQISFNTNFFPSFVINQHLKGCKKCIFHCLKWQSFNKIWKNDQILNKVWKKMLYQNFSEAQESSIIC